MSTRPISWTQRCPSHLCTALLVYSIDEEKCTGCGRCRRACPVEAITGEKKEPHKLDSGKCIKCGTCFEKCNFEAIVRM